MDEPITTAGRRWLVEAESYMDDDHLPLLRRRVLAIEREAAQQERERIRAAITAQHSFLTPDLRRVYAILAEPSDD